MSKPAEHKCDDCGRVMPIEALDKVPQPHGKNKGAKYSWRCKNRDECAAKR